MNEGLKFQPFRTTREIKVPVIRRFFVPQARIYFVSVSRLCFLQGNEEGVNERALSFAHA